MIVAAYFYIPNKLIEIGLICKIERHSYFQKVVGKKFKIEDPMIVAFNFKDESYTHFPYYKHLFFKKDLNRDLEDKDLRYDYKEFDNNSVLTAKDCHKTVTTAYIIVEDDHHEVYAISDFIFRYLKLNINERY